MKLVKIIATNSAIFHQDERCSVSRIIFNQTNDILANKCSLHGFYFINQKHDWSIENRMHDPILHFKDNVRLNEKAVLN